MKYAIAFTLCMIPTAAGAGTMPCSDRADVLAQLGAKYKEVPVSSGISNTGALIEVLSSPDGSTWTIVLTMPGENKAIKSCLLAAGEEWHEVEHLNPDDPSL